MDIQEKKHFLINSLYYTVLFVLAFISYWFITKYLLPFVIAFLLVVILRKPSVKIAEKLKIKTKYVNILLVLASFLVLFLLLGILAVIITHKIEKNSIMIFFKNMADTVSHSINALLQKIEKYLPEMAQSAVYSSISNIPQKIGESAPEMLTKAVSKLPKFFFGFAVTVAAGCYFANEYEPLKKFFLAVVPQNKIVLIKKIKNIMGKSVLRIFKGYAIISSVIFAVCFFALLLVGNKNAFLWSIFVSCVDLLPVLGAGSVLVPWAIISLFNGNYLYLAVLSAVYICTMLIHHILEPKILGDRVGVPPLIALVVMFTALRVFGILGMIIAVLALVTVINLYKGEDVTN